jgi:microcystin-dependent protein
MATQGIRIQDLPNQNTINVKETNNFIILSKNSEATYKLPIDTLFYSITSSIFSNFNALNYIGSGAIQTNKIGDSQITEPKLSADIRSKLSFIGIPSGAVMAFAMNSEPTGWLICDGRSVSRNDYASLFSSIGTTYGSSSSTTFNIPDMRGYFIRGSGTNLDGTASGSFGTKQADQFENHTHSIEDDGHTHTGTANTAGSHTHSQNQSGSKDDGGPRVPTGKGNSGIVANINAAGDHTHTITIKEKKTGIKILNPNTGSRGSETRPSNIALLYCIKI